MSSVPILLDCDTGIDDAYSLVLAARASSRLHLVGVTCVAGNASVDTVTRNTQAVLSVATAQRTCLWRVAWRTRSSNRRTLSANSRRDGLGDLALAQRFEARCNSRRSMCDMRVNSFQTRRVTTLATLTLVALAPLTNVAVALRLDPALKRVSNALS
jgi:pyrimidine-specific ribonucleoside hydrolase